MKEYLQLAKEVIQTTKQITDEFNNLFDSDSHEPLDHQRSDLEKKVATETTKASTDLKSDIETKLHAEQQQMLTTLSEYCSVLLTPQDQKALKTMFLGNSLQEYIAEYLKEKAYINHEKQKGNTGPEQALSKFYDMYDPTTNIQTVLEGISTQYFKYSLKERYLATHRHFAQQLKDQPLLKKHKQSLATHTDQTRITEQPTENLLRYTQEEQEKQKTGLAFKVDKTNEWGFKTPEEIAQRFQSSGVLYNPKTQVTQCSKTARLDAQRLFHCTFPRGNAFDAMRIESGSFQSSIASLNYKKKERAKKKVKSYHSDTELGQSEIINKLAPKDTNVADLYVTSSARVGKKYGHRALMFRVDEQRYVLDPYTKVEGLADNAPKPLETYAHAMKNGNNYREFMRMNFYKAPVELNSVA